MGKREVGIKDVARLAGVSVGTVSNVLNRPELVSAARRSSVERAIMTLGYVPNDAARRLKAGNSRTVGLVVVDSRNPFYAQLVSAVDVEADEAGLGVFVAYSARNLVREQFHLQQFAEQRARGVLLAPCSPDLTHARRIRDRGARVVLVDAVTAGEGFCSVASDDRHGGYLAVRHLLDLGRRNILMVGGPAQFRQVGERQSGALSAAAEVPDARISYVEPPEMSILAGRAAGSDILSMPEGERPDGIFAMNDLLATGILQALYMEGRVCVPEEIALVGYDDIDFCESAVVPISSVRQPSREMGAVGIQLLEEEISHPRQHDHRSVLLKPTLIPRESTIGAGR